MTNMNPDHDYSNLAVAVRFALRQGLKDVYTSMPGIVRAYDPETRRATIQGALSIATTDGRVIDREPIHDVPVIFPAGGGFALTFPLVPGDPVLLVYAQRGLAGFKKTHELSTPDLDGFFSEKDAVAIPGFGVRRDDTSHRIDVSSAGIHITTLGTVAIEAADVTFKTIGTDDDAESIV